MSEPTGSLNLAFRCENEIVLPAGLAESGLTLAEIGAITCLACLQQGAADDAAIFGTKEIQDAMKSLMAKNIFKPRFEDGAIKIDVDLTSVA